jgi:predicted DNA-binding protein (MmcQ/YjbR family)
MTHDKFNIYCSPLPATKNFIQWCNSSVWKVGGKIFTICSHLGEGDQQKISFKCSDMSYETLCE